MISLRRLCALLCLGCLVHVGTCQVISVTLDNTKKYNIVYGTVADRVAWANHTIETSSTGWAYLDVTTNASYPDEVQAYAAGLAEGYLTKDLIYMHWMNTVDGYCNNETAYCARLTQYLKTNMAWMKQQIIKNGQKDPYWHQISLMLIQLNGLEAGYLYDDGIKKAMKKLRENDLGFIMIQISGDLEDLEAVLKKSANLRRVKGSGSCSALIKVLPKNEEIYVSQVSWNTYQSMLRILKKYTFNYHLTPDKQSPIVPGSSMSFSSYPGLLMSGDDFYVISSKLVTMETTIGNSNSDLWKYVTPVGSILEWMRCLAANRIASQGELWTKIFIKFNSGTYNNQWMVVDYKVFESQKPLKDNLLWVIEQLPKYFVAADKTDVLRNQSYWPSYNSPYFPLIYNMSGAYKDALKYGDWFSYDKTPRALIFRRDNHKVLDLVGMLKLMRYNDYKNDPLSRCNCTPPYSAENAISARCDLNPKNGTYPFPSLGHRSHGGIDAKMSSSELSGKLAFVAVSGPSRDQQPTFCWSNSDFDFNTPHMGHPDCWDFFPVLFDGQKRNWH